MNMLVRNRLNNFPFFGNHNTNSLLKEVDNFASELFGNVTYEGFSPVFGIEESKESYKITVELPGMELNDVEVNLKENSLIISGEKKSEEDEKKRHYTEIKYGKFERVFNLGEDVNTENIKAAMKNGVLSITLNKIEKAVNTPKKIEITEG